MEKPPQRLTLTPVKVATKLPAESALAWVIVGAPARRRRTPHPLVCVEGAPAHRGRCGPDELQMRGRATGVATCGPGGEDQHRGRRRYRSGAAAHGLSMAPVSRPANAPVTQQRLLRRGLRLEYATLAWNVVGSVVLLAAAVAVGSLALAGFGVDSVIEIVASAVVVWQLKGTAGDGRDRRALRVIATAFALLALYIAAQAAHTLLVADHPGTSTVASRG